MHRKHNFSHRLILSRILTRCSEARAIRCDDSLCSWHGNVRHNSRTIRVARSLAIVIHHQPAFYATRPLPHLATLTSILPPLKPIYSVLSSSSPSTGGIYLYLCYTLIIYSRTCSRTSVSVALQTISARLRDDHSGEETNKERACPAPPSLSLSCLSSPRRSTARNSLHPRESRHKEPMPLIITHGWPGRSSRCST